MDNTTAGRFTASANWGTSTYSGQRYGADYRFADPVAASDAAWYQAAIPATANYRVEAWYPADPGYNSSAPYIVATASGNQTVYVDQRHRRRQPGAPSAPSPSTPAPTTWSA